MQFRSRLPIKKHKKWAALLQPIFKLSMVSFLAVVDILCIVTGSPDKNFPADKQDLGMTISQIKEIKGEPLTREKDMGNGEISY